MTHWLPTRAHLVYCTCFIKTVLVFTASQKDSLPRCSHTHPDSPTRTFTPRPTHPHQWQCEGQTPKFRQLLGKSCWFFTFSWRKTKSTGDAFGHHNASYVCIHMAVNTECSSHIPHRTTATSVSLLPVVTSQFRGLFLKIIQVYGSEIRHN